MGLAVLIFLWMVGQPRALTLEEVARDIICLCGCGKLLSICQMQGWAVPAKELIVEQIAQGKDKAAILAYFVEQYGEKILAAPTKRGFNLMAWILPFFAITAGGVGISMVLLRWKRDAPRRDLEEPASSAPQFEEHMEVEFSERLESELAELG